MYTLRNTVRSVCTHSAHLRALPLLVQRYLYLTGTDRDERRRDLTCEPCESDIIRVSGSHRYGIRVRMCRGSCVGHTAGSLCESITHECLKARSPSTSRPWPPSAAARPGLMAPRSTSMALQASAPGELRGALGSQTFLATGELFAPSPTVAWAAHLPNLTD